LEILKKNPMDLKYFKNQTDEICLAAVKKDPSALQ